MSKFRMDQLGEQVTIQTSSLANATTSRPNDSTTNTTIRSNQQCFNSLAWSGQTTCYNKVTKQENQHPLILQASKQNVANSRDNLNEIALDDNDQVTNCSETMSTAYEDDYSINRLNCWPQATSLNVCDNQEQANQIESDNNDLNNNINNNASRRHLEIISLEAGDEPTMSSLASLNQAPPSYGTAVAQLDAGQLQLTANFANRAEFAPNQVCQSRLELANRETNRYQQNLNSMNELNVAQSSQYKLNLVRNGQSSRLVPFDGHTFIHSGQMQLHQHQHQHQMETIKQLANGMSEQRQQINHHVISRRSPMQPAGSFAGLQQHYATLAAPAATCAGWPSPPAPINATQQPHQYATQHFGGRSAGPSGLPVASATSAGSARRPQTRRKRRRFRSVSARSPGRPRLWPAESSDELSDRLTNTSTSAHSNEHAHPPEADFDQADGGHLTLALRRQEQQQQARASRRRHAHPSRSCASTLERPAPAALNRSRSHKSLLTDHWPHSAASRCTAASTAVSVGRPRAARSETRLSTFFGMLAGLVRRPQRTASPNNQLASYTAASLAVSSASSSSAYASGSQPSSSSQAASSSRAAELSGRYRPTLHAYEPCEPPDRLEIETKFGSSGSADSANENSLSSGHSNPSLSPAQTGRRVQPPAPPSDHELISAASEPSARLASVLPTPNRRRWQLHSLKCWLRRPCQPNESQGCGQRVLGPAGSRPETQSTGRYKSLRGRRSPISNCPTIENIISLARADQIFRFRLIASVLISLVLLALICLLVGLIYARSIHMYQNNRLNLLIDDSDYDLSWLVSPEQITNHQTPIPLNNNNNNKLPPIQLMPPKNQDQFEGSIRIQLALIERSDQLDQLQMSMTHLTNLQLANDHFLDLTKLAKELTWPHCSPEQVDSASKSEPIASAGTEYQLCEPERQLASLILLSNVHWPLVKWRHQSQQSLAHFLSFSVSSIASGARQGARNLLALLMLAEDNPSLLLSSSNLRQFVRLNNLLKDTSRHLLACSLNLQSDQPNSSQLHSFMALTRRRRRFCFILLERYRRMMTTLGQLDHHHLSDLYEPSEIQLLASSQSFKQAAPGKSLLGFLLDRLSPLDVQLIAELTLVIDGDELVEAAQRGDDEAAISASASDDEDDADFQQTDTSNYQTFNILSANLNNYQLVNQSDIHQSKSVSLFDLAKKLATDNLNLDKNLDFEQQLERSKQQTSNKIDELDLLANEQTRELVYPWNWPRLPKFITPLNYDLFLHPNLTSRLVLGMVKIELKLIRPTRHIVLHCDRLNLAELTVWLRRPPQIQQNINAQANLNYSNTRNNKQQTIITNGPLIQIPIRRVLLDKKLELLHIELEDLIEHNEPLQRNQLQQNNNINPSTTTKRLEFGEIPSLPLKQKLLQTSSLFIINISFNKTSQMLTNQNHQIQESNEQASLQYLQYVDYFSQPEAEQRIILYSQFEPANARRLFPCFDEPQFRSKFQLNLVHDQQHQVLFNSAKRERVPYTSDGNLQMSVFEPSPIPLSTYLVSLIVCDSQNIKSITSRAIQFQVANNFQQPTLSFNGNQNDNLNSIGASNLNPSNFEQISSSSSSSSASSSASASSYSSNSFIQESNLHLNSNHNNLKQLPAHIQVQIYAQFEHLGRAEFASQLVPQLLSFYQVHLEFPYPMDKLDLVALPKRASPNSLNAIKSMKLILPSKSSTIFSSLVSTMQTSPLEFTNNKQQQFGPPAVDTMENMGLLWFKAPLLLADPNLISQDLIEQISLIISHQIAHQYFGNIVSIKRWSDLWLYEALCQYLESIALGSVQSDWRLEEQFPVTTIQETLAQAHYEHYETTLPDVSTLFKGSIEASSTLFPLSSAPPLEETLVSGAGIAQQEQLEQRMVAASIEQPQWRPASLSLGKKEAAIVHMLLLNLLPSPESQARLMRRCLEAHKNRPMSSGQFWNRFAEQLALEGSAERLALAPPGWRPSLVGASGSGAIIHEPETSERVVFVRQNHHQPSRGAGRAGATAHLAAAGRPSARLDLVANAWLEHADLPLVNARLYRDKIQLSQEPFNFEFGSSSDQSSDSSEGDAEQVDLAQAEGSQETPEDTHNQDVWPIPLMFISRQNPKNPRFVWLNQRELEIPIHSVDSNRPGEYRDSAGGRFGSWFKLNVNQSSLIRVNYDERNWEALADLMAKSHYSNHLLGPLDRANVLDDAFTLMRFGRLSVGLAMNLTLYLEVGERDYQPWTSVLKHLDQLQALLNQNPLWHRYVLKLLQPISSIIGWKDDGPHLMRKLRRHLFSVALQFGDEKTVNKAKQEFRTMLKSGRFIVPNLQELVYVAGVRYGDQQEWFHCWQKYQQLVALDLSNSNNQRNNLQQHQQQHHHHQHHHQQQQQQHQLLQTSMNIDGGAFAQLARSSEKQAYSAAGNGLLAASVAAQAASSSEPGEPNTENEKRQLLTALASTQNTWLMEQFLNYSLDPTKIQAHHLKHVLQTLGKNPVARLYLWRFVRLNWLHLMEQFNTHQQQQQNNLNDQDTMIEIDNLSAMIVESTKHFSSKLDFDEVKMFFDSKRQQMSQVWPAPIERAIRRSLHVIKANIYWRDNIEPKLTKWLSNFHSIA